MSQEPNSIPIDTGSPPRLSDEARERANSRLDFSAADIVRGLRRRSISVDRLTCPKLFDQLLSAPHRPIDDVVCCAVDADEDAPLNHVIIRDFSDEVLAGLHLAARAVAAQRTFVVTNPRLPDKPWPSAAVGQPMPSVLTADLTYPQMHPSQLVQKLLRRPMHPAALPPERGVLVIDAAAAWVIARLAGEVPEMKLPIFVHDDRSQTGTLAWAAPEEPLGALLSSMAIRTDSRTLIIDGPRLRKRQSAPSTRAGNLDGVLHVCEADGLIAAEPCTRCNWCAEICPTGVLPMLVLEAAQFGNVVAAARAGARNCLSCGLCDYVCPSRLPLMHAVEQTNLSLLAGNNA